MITFEFNRVKMRQRLAIYGTILLVSLAVFGVWFWFHLVLTGWIKWPIFVMMIVIIFCSIEYARWVGVLVRGLRREGAAVIVNQNGIVDNGSDYCLGHLPWNEIRTIYPWDLNSRLLVNGWARMPVIIKQRGIVVYLKDGTDFQQCVKGKPWFARLRIKSWFLQERRQWFFIPEMFLDVTADDFMRRLNQFYTSQVRDVA